VHTGYWCGDLREINQWEDPDIDGKVILQWAVQKWDVGMEWIYVTQHNDTWLALVNAVMKHKIP
jgi:hypothetical protein